MLPSSVAHLVHERGPRRGAALGVGAALQPPLALPRAGSAAGAVRLGAPQRLHAGRAAGAGAARGDLRLTRGAQRCRRLQSCSPRAGCPRAHHWPAGQSRGGAGGGWSADAGAGGGRQTPRGRSSAWAPCRAPRRRPTPQDHCRRRLRPALRLQRAGRAAVGLPPCPDARLMPPRRARTTQHPSPSMKQRLRGPGSAPPGVSTEQPAQPPPVLVVR